MKKIVSVLTVAVVSGIGYMAIGPKTAVAVIVVYVALICIARIIGDCMGRNSHGGM